MSQVRIVTPPDLVAAPGLSFPGTRTGSPAPVLAFDCRKTVSIAREALILGMVPFEPRPRQNSLTTWLGRIAESLHGNHLPCGGAAGASTGRSPGVDVA